MSTEAARVGILARLAINAAACCSIALLRLTYLGVVNAFATLCLLPMSERGTDAELLAPRHQITVLDSQLGAGKLQFTPSDRTFLAALRRHRDLVGRRHAQASRPKRPGRPRTVRSVRALVSRLAREESARVSLTHQQAPT